jgi:hypothetical protein
MFHYQPTPFSAAFSFATFGATGDAFSFARRRCMPGTPEVSHDLLSELTRALTRLPGTALDSLDGLRDSVHGFAKRQRLRGTSLEDSILAVHRELMAAEDEVMAAFLSTEPRDPALARQVRAWCSEGYTNGNGKKG